MVHRSVFLIPITGMTLFMPLGASEYAIDTFRIIEREIPPASNEIIKSPQGGPLVHASDSEVMGPGELILRRRFGPAVYELFKGGMTDSAIAGALNLFIFPIPGGMTSREAMKLKFYSDKTINLDNDIPNVYFDKERIYVELFSSIYWNDSSSWHVLKSLPRMKLTGDLFVSSRPAGAQIFVDERNMQQKTDGYITGLFIGEHLVSVERDGYRKASKKVTINSEGLEKVPFELVSALGSLSITTVPPGATVTLSGVEKGITPLVLPGMEPGKYPLLLERQNYLSINDTATVRMSDTTVINKTLRPDFGSVYIYSVPSGARLSIGGIVAATTPASFEHQKPGVYKILVESDTCKPAETTLTVNRGDSIVWNVRLSPLNGALILPPVPTGFAFTVDGQAIEGGAMRLPAGTHYVKFEGRGLYPSLDTVVEVIAGSSVFFRKDTTHLTGSLKIMPVPSDAEVTLDDAAKIAVPQIVAGIPTGPHVLTIARDGYRTLRDTVFVSQNGITSVQPRLVLMAEPSNIAAAPSGTAGTTAAAIPVRGKNAGRIVALPSPDSMKTVKTKRHKGFISAIRISSAVLGAGCAVTGYYFNSKYNDSYNAYRGSTDQNIIDQQWSAASRNKQNRNIFYAGAGILGGLFVISFAF